VFLVQTCEVALVEQQMEYCRLRVGEYDQWWFRQGRYRLVPEDERQWLADVAEVEAATRKGLPPVRLTPDL
jgi:hypothetical protein